MGRIGPVGRMFGEGWVHRHYEPTVPPLMTYSITKKVMELEQVMVELDRIAELWYGKGR